MAESELHTDIEEVARTWTAYLSSSQFDWRVCVDGVDPKHGGCGLVYEVGNPLARSNEGLAIADMRNLDIADPHYHVNGETEIYVVIQGTGTVVVGNELNEVGPGDAVITRPGVTHYTVPHDQLVLGVVNTPPFDPTNSVFVSESDPAVQFDAHLFKRLAERERDSALNTLLRDLTVELDAWSAVLLVAGIRPDRLVCRARYELPLDWGVYGNLLDSGSDNATAFNTQQEIIDNNVLQNIPPSPTGARVSEHKMTASAVVLLPSRMGTLECLADTDGYTFDESKVSRMREVALAVATVLTSEH